MNPFSPHTEKLKERLSIQREDEYEETFQEPRPYTMEVEEEEPNIVRYPISLNRMEPPPSIKYLCIYRINRAQPFLEYLLIKNDKQLTFKSSYDPDKTIETIGGKPTNSQGYMEFENKILVFFAFKTIDFSEFEIFENFLKN